MKDLWNFLKESPNPVVLYGMGDGADKIISALNNYGIKVSGVFASDGFVRQKEFHGFNVTDYKTAKETYKDMTVLLCFGSPLKPVIDNIRRIAGECTLFAPDVPVYGGPLFNAEFYEQNLEKIEKVKGMLADDVSVKCFENIIKYKLSGDINLLFECETPESEVYENILTLSDKEIFADLGAYRGDTVLSFAERVGDYKKIYAVEPDKKTFSKLLANTKSLKNIIAFNAAVSDKCGKVGFNFTASRGSSIKAGEDIDCLTVDSIIKDGGCTFIKADVEGAELKMIEGAEKTIKKYRPKLKIAAYHRSEDIFEIPLKIHSINPDYKIYLRHFPCLPAWDTDYYFI